MTDKHKNYYEILEIPFSSTPEEINLGFTRAKNAYAKDSLALYSIMSKEECDDILNLIDEAYSIISDPEKRKLYDHARGINKNTSSSFYDSAAWPTKTATEFSETIVSTNNNHHSVANIGSLSEKKSTGPLSKIVAKNKFALDFTVNGQFETEIEKIAEYSGEFLKKVREYKNVDINRMAEMTKVSKTYLLNIEEEKIDNLPALVYVRGFIYQYAKCLKLNPDLVATSYLTRLKTLQGEAS